MKFDFRKILQNEPRLRDTLDLVSGLSETPDKTNPGSHKRKRGGQKGNQNARKHGYYSASLTEAEHAEFLDIITTEDIDPQIARIRVKLMTLLREDPYNTRALRDGANEITRQHKQKFGLEGADVYLFREFIDSILQGFANEIIRHKNESPGTGQSEADSEKRTPLVNSISLDLIRKKFPAARNEIESLF